MAQALLDQPAEQGALSAASSAIDAPVKGAPVLVIGGGPCGMRVAQNIARAGRDVVVLNAEKWEPYNRVKLTPLLAGDVQLGDVTSPLGAKGPGDLSIVNGARATRLDLARRVVHAADGGVWPYSALVLAMGSRAFVPNIPGKDRPGVYTFRDASDVEALIARSFRARDVVVVGGGLLGLEAARGMHRRGARVTVVEHENRLMPRQLDEEAAALLGERIAALGVRVETSARVAEIAGEAGDEGEDKLEDGGRGPVASIVLADGRRIAADTVIICTGVRANVDLAREAGMTVGRGVIVNDRMRSSAIDVFAVGECAEHRGLVYGLVGPGLEQADVAARVIAGRAGAEALGGPEATADYAGSTPATKLKVIGAEVFSIGDVENLEQRPNVVSRIWRDKEKGLYRRIFVERGRLAGAIAVGAWPDASRVQAAALENARVYPWMLWRFAKQGALWSEPVGGAAALPPQAIVCNCTGVTAGRIQNALTLGAGSLEEVKSATGASTVCGTCGPKIEEILAGGGAAPKPVRLSKPLLWFSGIAALLALVTLLAPRIPLPDTYQGAPIMEALWFDNIVKQWSGYLLAGLSVAAAAIGLRKRISLLRRLGGYDWWRVTHLVLGVVCVLALFAHTGFRFGSGLNFWLMLSFSVTLLAGAVSGLFTGGEHVLRARGLASAERTPRTPSLWIHVLAAWPLPALVLLHVLSVYVY